MSTAVGTAAGWLARRSTWGALANGTAGRGCRGPAAPERPHLEGAWPLTQLSVPAPPNRVATQPVHAACSEDGQPSQTLQARAAPSHSPSPPRPETRVDGTLPPPSTRGRAQPPPAPIAFWNVLSSVKEPHHELPGEGASVTPGQAPGATPRWQDWDPRPAFPCGQGAAGTVPGWLPQQHCPGSGPW